jgi:hypothetical protein
LPDIRIKDILVWQHFLPCRLNTLNVIMSDIANIFINVGAHLDPPSSLPPTFWSVVHPSSFY